MVFLYLFQSQSESDSDEDRQILAERTRSASGKEFVVRILQYCTIGLPCYKVDGAVAAAGVVVTVVTVVVVVRINQTTLTMKYKTFIN